MKMKIQEIFKTLNNILMGGITILFIAFNAMFYSMFDKNDTVSVYFLLTLSFIFYLIILVIYAIMKNSNNGKTIEEFTIVYIFENDNGTHLILKENDRLTLNTVCSIYCVEKNGYENFCGLGYVYNIAKDKKIDIKMIESSSKDFAKNNSKNKKGIIIKKELNYENLQIIRGG